ncbi:MAG: helix-turn-helix domain-containing protein [Bacteroidia bacterium]
MTKSMLRQYNMVKPIKNNEQYELYLELAYNLMQLDLEENSKESDELEVLSIMIEQYEKIHYPIDTPGPIEAIKFRMDQLNMKKSELEKVLGYRSRISDIFSGRRKLSLGMIRRIHEKLDVPAEILIKEY